MTSAPRSEVPKALLRFINVGYDVEFASTGPRRILDNFVLDVLPSEVVSICGLSGSGKSTIARLAVGLGAPSDGKVVFDGREIADVPKGVAIVFQEYSATIFPWMTVHQNVQLGAEKHNRASPRVLDAIAAVGLKDRKDSRVVHLSGGQRQRVALARALAGAPRLLVLDEAFAALDFVVRKRLVEELRTLALERELAVLFVTHDIEDAIALGDRIVVLTRYVNVTNFSTLSVQRHRRNGTASNRAELLSTISAVMRADALRDQVSNA